MRLLISVCLGLAFSGCSSASPGLSNGPVRKLAREAADTSWLLCREAVVRSCSKLTQSLPNEVAMPTWSSLDARAEARVSQVARRVRALSSKLKVASPALSRAVGTTARVQLKASRKVLCDAAARLPMAASPLTLC